MGFGKCRWRGKRYSNSRDAFGYSPEASPCKPRTKDQGPRPMLQERRKQGASLGLEFWHCSCAVCGQLRLGDALPPNQGPRPAPLEPVAVNGAPRSGEIGQSASDLGPKRNYPTNFLRTHQIRAFLTRKGAKLVGCPLRERSDLDNERVK